jgi:hypothetical protein
MLKINVNINNQILFYLFFRNIYNNKFKNFLNLILDEKY